MFDPERIMNYSILHKVISIAKHPPKRKGIPIQENGKKGDLGKGKQSESEPKSHPNIPTHL